LSVADASHFISVLIDADGDPLAVLGVVDVSGPALTLHPAIGALVQTATRLAEMRLWQHHRLRLDHLRAGGRPPAGRAGPRAVRTGADTGRLADPPGRGRADHQRCVGRVRRA
jgi:hypothetical protein